MISTDTSANVIQDAPASQDQVGGEAAWRRPRTAALACLVAYLAVTGGVLAAGGHGGLALAHVAVIAVALWSAPVILRGRSNFGHPEERSNFGHPEERSDEGSFRLAQRSFASLRMTIGALRMTIGDFLPLIAAPLLYAEIPSLIAGIGSTYHDGAVQRWEQALFGWQPAHALAGRLPFTALSEVLHAGYLAYYLVIFVPPLLLFAARERRGFAETVLALTLTCTLCWTIFMLFPVEGPRYLWTPAGVPDGPMRRLAVRLLAAGSSRGAAFPSSHMAVSVSQFVLAWRWQRPVAWGVLVVAILIGFGAVYGGFHYGVDMIAGAVLGVAVSLSAILVCARAPRGA
jgi:membrane-associated phospholipid phosphatase